MSTDVRIRPAVLEKDDNGFMLRAFDSALPHLASIGSGDQWGSEPFTSKPSQVEYTRGAVQRSEQIQSLLAEATPDQTGSTAAIFRSALTKFSQEQWDEMFVAERQDSTSDASVRLGAMTCCLYAPPYIVRTRPDIFASVTTLQPDQHATDAPPPAFVYLGRLIVHRDPLDIHSQHGEAATSVDLARSAALGKGVGGQMVRYAVGQARARGIPTMFVDCWSGNSGKLIKYYESLGFQRAGAFEVQDKHVPGKPWTGELLRMDLI